MLYQWITEPKTDVEHWINKFYEHQVMGIYNKTYGVNKSDIAEGIRSHYRAGYCYAFAHMLKAVFNRGQVCWAAPTSHVCFLDEDNIAYDCEGRYSGEAYDMIPEKYCGNLLEGYKHIPGHDHFITKEEILEVISNYVQEMNYPISYYDDIAEMLPDEEEIEKRKKESKTDFFHS